MRSEVSSSVALSLSAPQLSTHRFRRTCLEYWRTGPSPRSASERPWWFSILNWSCSVGWRRLQSTMHTDRATCEARISPAWAHVHVLPLPDSVPVNTTRRGASPPGTRNTRCTSLVISSRAIPSISKGGTETKTSCTGTLGGGTSCVSSTCALPIWFSSSKFLLMVAVDSLSPMFLAGVNLAEGIQESCEPETRSCRKWVSNLAVECVNRDLRLRNSGLIR